MRNSILEIVWTATSVAYGSPHSSNPKLGYGRFFSSLMKATWLVGGGQVCHCY